jgi:hypothetical protein
MKYKIFWIDATTARQPSKIFENWKTIDDDGVWKECEVWKFIEARSDLEAIQKTREFVEANDRIMDVFNLSRRGRLIATEEDIFE